MTIFFSGHNFKYELEGIVKLFFPVMRFSHIFNDVKTPQGDYIITRLKKGKTKTYLWVYICINNKKIRKCSSIDNNIKAYTNETERILCVLLYKSLSFLMEFKPPWGILTGIRPVANIIKLRESGISDQEIKDYLTNKFLISEKKQQLAFMTANNQQQILDCKNKNSYSLYVSIPFCTSRCSYCSFVSSAINTKKAVEKVEEYINLLCLELEHTSKIADKLKLKLETIYIGGGTPTAITAKQLKTVTDAIKANFNVANAKEYTIEAGRADSITKEKLEVIKKAGATRISINPQTFNDEILKNIGRNHTVQDVINCFNMAKEIGFKNINMDLIAGLPGETLESFKNSINKIIELSPSNITVHTLSIKRSSDFYESNPDIKHDLTYLMNEYSQKKIIKYGYQPYYLYRQKNTIGNLENIGYAKGDLKSIYNIYIMDECQTILACGAGASTKLVRNGEIKRVFNYKYHFEYINNFEEIIKRKNEVLDFYDYY